MPAQTFCKPGEQLLVVFTHGFHVTINADHSGTTGKWTMNPNRAIDRVLIYQRDEATGVATLYLGTYARATPSDLAGKYDVHLTHVQYVGTTSESWKSFAGEGQNPIRYLP